MYVSPINKSWHPTSESWNSLALSCGNHIDQTFLPTGTTGWLELDVLSYLTGVINNGTENNGIMLSCITSYVGNSGGQVSFLASSEHSNSSISPRLEIEYSTGTVTTYELIVNSGSGDGNYKEGENQTITADEAPSGKEFDKWTGDIQYLANPNSSTTTVTMPSQNITVTATYKDLGPVEKKDNYMVISSWEGGADDMGNSKVSVNNSQKADTILTVNLKLGTSDEANEKWAWAQVSGYADGDFSQIRSIEMIYYSNEPVNIVLDQEGLSANGESYYKQLPAASRGKVILSVTDFAQPSWVGASTPLDKSKIISISFAAVSEGTTTNLELQGIYIDGFKENTPITNVTSIINNNGVFVKSISSNQLVIGNAKVGQTEVSIFNASGKNIYSVSRDLSVNSTVNITSKDLSSGVYIVRIKGANEIRVSNHIIN